MKLAIYLFFFIFSSHLPTVITHGGRFLWQWFSGQRQETLLSFLQSSRKKSCTFVERHRNFLSENLFGREIPIDNQCTWDTASNLPEILGRIYMGFRILAFCVLIAIVSFVYVYLSCNALAAIERDDFTLATDEEEDIDNNDTTAKIQTFKTQKLIDYANIKKGSDQRMHVLRKVEFIWPWGPHEVYASLLLYFQLLLRFRIIYKMSKTHPPELKKYMDKKLQLKLNGNRVVSGILRGFDPFMNLVIDEAVEHAKGGEQNQMGMIVIRGNSIVLMEVLERI